MTLRVLQVGVGARGRLWRQVLQRIDSCKIVGFVDIDPSALEQMKAAFPDDELVMETDLRPAIERTKPDVLVLVTPPETHREQVRIGLEFGIALMVEKPLSTDLGEAWALTKMAKEAGVPMSICLNFRYLEVTQGIKRLIEEEVKGTPNFGQFTYLRNRDGKMPGLNRYPLYMKHPMLLEQSIHHFDLIRYVYGREVQSVQAETWNPPWSMYAGDSNVAALLTLEDDLRVQYLGTWTSGWNDMGFEWRTDCSRGVIIQKQLFSDLYYADMQSDDPNPVIEKGGGGGGGPLERVSFVSEDEPFFDDTEALMRQFAHALADEGVPYPSTAQDHLRSLAVVFAAIRSAEEGRRITLDAIYRDYGISIS